MRRPGRIGFLHTAEVHRATFDALVADLVPRANSVAIVDPSLLADAQRTGPATASVSRRIGTALEALRDAGAEVVVCTCSTIAGEAAAQGTARSVPVVRVDQPMAEAAVGHGPRLAVVAALASALGPTIESIEQAAEARGCVVETSEHLVAGAWALFAAGDLPGYLEAVAAACRRVVGSSDAIVLAQASMADVAAMVDLHVPVLSSPRLAVQAAAQRLAPDRR